MWCDEIFFLPDGESLSALLNTHEIPDKNIVVPVVVYRYQVLGSFLSMHEQVLEHSVVHTLEQDMQFRQRYQLFSAL